jgi:outer membrane autotransporter protein
MRVTYSRAGSNSGCEPPRPCDRRSGVIARRSVFLLSGTAAIALSIAQPAGAITINDPAAAAVGGIENYYDSANKFPNVVSLFITQNPNPVFRTSYCTGTLINARTVLTAGHCGQALSLTGQPSISFAPIAGPGDPLFTATSSFVVNPNISQGQNDVALISLANPVTSVTPVTLINASTPIPTPGTTLTMAGYGFRGTGTNCCTEEGKRLIATTSLGAYEPSSGRSGIGTTQPFYRAQFRIPSSPDNPNYFHLTVPVTELSGTPDQGDSGGPLFIQTAQGLVQIGVVQGGYNPVGDPGFYGDINDWTPVNLFLDWIAQNDPLRRVTAAAGNFTWSNPAAWVDSVPGVVSAVPSNTVAGYTVGARYYDVTLSNPGTITLDMNPTIDTLAIAGAQSQLVIDAPYTLGVVVSTTLSAGTLAMRGGTLISPEFLMSGGLLTGNGTIVAAGGEAGFNTGLCNSGMCVTGGAVAPVGTLSIQGNYTQTGGLLQFHLAPTGVNGQLAVSNTATLGGTLGAVITPGLYHRSTQYRLLTAGAVSGQFAQVLSPSAFLSLSPVYGPTSVDVTLIRTPFGAVAGLTRNQQAVGNALEGAYRTTLTGPAATLYANLLVTGTPNSLSQLSGEGITATQNTAFATGRMFDSLMMDQGVFWRSGETADSEGVTFRAEPLAYAAEKEKTAAPVFKELKLPPPVYQPRTWRVWTGAFGGVQSFNGDAVVGSADARTGAAGGAMGFDYQADPTRLVGVAVGGSESHFSVPDRATSGDLLGGHVGAYGVATWGGLYAAGVLSYSRFDNDVRRTIAGAGPTETATGRFASDLFGARLEVGRSYALQWLNVTPFAAVQTSTLWQRGFTETSTAAGLPGILGLISQSQTTTSLPTFLGVQLDTRLALANGTVWAPFLRAAWVHEFTPDRSIANSFVSIPGTLFTVDGARAWSDALKLNAGTRVALNQYASLFASFDGEFAERGQSYAGRGGIRFGW